jgi:acylphosphatase
MIAYQIYVSGWVQGVGFRWFAQRLAEGWGIQGWVRNLPDGRVEVFAQADRDALNAFCDRLREGPSHGSVDDLTIETVSVDHKLHRFQIRF